MFGLGLPELMVILVIVMVLFGAKQVAGTCKRNGKSYQKFQKSSTEPDEIDVTPKKSIVEDKNPG